MIKDRKATERRLLEAVGEIIDESGIEFLGVNAVAKKAGVSKMLIYRYFGSVDKLMGHYIMQRDYWINIPDVKPGPANIKPFIKNLFREQIRKLRDDRLLVRLHRWELSTDSELVMQIRQLREKNGRQLIEYVSSISDIPYDQVQILATLISSSVTYLSMFSSQCSVYNGLEFDKDGWEKLEDGINDIIDKWL